MAYAKFVTKVNKGGKSIKYGPYYYRSVRTREGKVRNIYLGTDIPPENRNETTLGKMREALARFMAS